MIYPPLGTSGRLLGFGLKHMKMVLRFEAARHTLSLGTAYYHKGEAEREYERRPTGSRA